MASDIERAAMGLLAEIARFRGGDKPYDCPVCHRDTWRGEDHAECLALRARLFLDRHEAEIAAEAPDRFMEATRDICRAGG